MSEDRVAFLRSVIRDVPDFPKPGIVFKDITPMLANPKAFVCALDLVAEEFAGESIDAIVGIESRGFIFGAALAARMGASFVPARKPGKLPAAVDRVAYELEYGTDSLEMHKHSLPEGGRVLVVDDLIATGGTAQASGELIRKQGASVAAYVFIIELTALKGRKRLGNDRVVSILSY